MSNSTRLLDVVETVDVGIVFIVVPHRRDDDRVPSLLLPDASPTLAPIDHNNPPASAVFSLDFCNIDDLVVEPDLFAFKQRTRKRGEIFVGLEQGRKRLIWSWWCWERILREGQKFRNHISDQIGVGWRRPTRLVGVIVAIVSITPSLIPLIIASHSW